MQMPTATAFNNVLKLRSAFSFGQQCICWCCATNADRHTHTRLMDPFFDGITHKRNWQMHESANSITYTVFRESLWSRNADVKSKSVARRVVETLAAFAVWTHYCWEILVQKSFQGGQSDHRTLLLKHPTFMIPLHRTFSINFTLITNFFRAVQTERRTLDALFYMEVGIDRVQQQRSMWATAPMSKGQELKFLQSPVGSTCCCL